MKTIQTRIALALVTTTATLALPAMADVDNRAPQHIGVSAGTVLGALLGGPVGAVAGATFGNFIGLDRIHDQKLAFTTRSLEVTEQQLATVTRSNAAAETELASLRAELAEQTASVAALKDLVREVPVAVLFESNSAALATEYQPTLDAMAKASTRLKDLNIGVVGHADPRGTDVENQALSDTRAAVVGGELIDRGASKHVVRWVGLGETVPTGVYSQDRRVELRLDFGVPTNDGVYSAQQ